MTGLARCTKKHWKAILLIMGSKGMEKNNEHYYLQYTFSLGQNSMDGSCCCFLTLTDPLRIQPWSQDRRNQTKSNRESEISMESRQKRTDKEVASKGHRRDKIET